MTVFDIREFGAVGDGVTNDAASIQAAIDAAGSTGGGTVLVPAGATFLSGSLLLRNYVELHIQRGAVLQASADWDQITQRLSVSALSAGVIGEEPRESGAFLWAEDATGIAVTGAGVIDGNGRGYVLEDLGEIYLMPVERPFPLFFLNCSDVTIRESTWRDGALWTIRLTGCEHVVIDGIRIDGDLKLPNVDGIDLDRCRNVRVSNCDIRCGDDAISLKTCEEFPDSGLCENIVVTNCVLQSTSSALVVGVDATSPIRNVVFDNCVVIASHRGLSVNLGQEGDFENILFSNIVVETRLFDDRWWGRGEPIYVSAYPWHEKVGRMRNVRFVNILARSENGAFISALHPDAIDGLLLENVQIELDAWSGLLGGWYDRRPFSQGIELYEHPTSGFHIDGATNVVLRDCEVTWGSAQPHFAHAVEAHRTEGLRITGLRGASARPGELVSISSEQPWT